MTTLKACSLAAATLALAAYSTSAGAADHSFRFHASELNSPEALYERMAARAEAACTTRGRKGLWSRSAEKACAADLLGDFVDGAGNPALTAIHAEGADAQLATLR